MNWKTNFIKHAKKEAPKEACGLLAIIDGKETFWPCKNLADGNFEFFVLDPDDWAECEDKGEVLGVIHSHPKGAAHPSETDKAACEHIGFPYYIYSIEHDNWQLLKPVGWKTPSLIGRTFIWGKHDCWSVINDWYLETKGIKLMNWERPKTLKEFLKHPEFEKALPLGGFKKQLTNENVETGDVLLFQSSTGNLDHVAVYIGDMMILNHNIKALSCRQLFDLNYQKALRGVYRYAA